jgi:hypothetical protein
MTRERDPEAAPGWPEDKEGASVGDFETIREAAQDDETRDFQRLAARRVPVLRGGGWEGIFEGADGLGAWGHRRLQRQLIHSIARELDGEVWAHVSVSRRDHRMPNWEQVRDIWRLVYPDTLGIVVVPPEDKHVSLAEVAHIWGCLTRPAAPDFTHGLGSI